AHQDVNAIDLTGAGAELAKELEIAAADNLKRVLRPLAAEADGSDASTDWSAAPGTHRLTAFLETKTVWHPTGALGASGSSY
ncbi:aldehyde dehydrogenase, partial [Streptomyces sp. SID8455]|nr:aldehyde dehydrogenase [Streptomyces sp. SID8455]